LKEGEWGGGWIERVVGGVGGEGGRWMGDLVRLGVGVEVWKVRAG